MKSRFNFDFGLIANKDHFSGKLFTARKYSDRRIYSVDLRMKLVRGLINVQSIPYHYSKHWNIIDTVVTAVRLTVL